MRVYIGKDFKCHVEDADGRTEFEINFFDGKCQTFIEGYRFVPQGESWTREDGVVFTGEMISPWKSFDELDQAQREYEQELAQAARILLGEVSA